MSPAPRMSRETLRGRIQDCRSGPAKGRRQERRQAKQNRLRLDHFFNLDVKFPVLKFFSSVLGLNYKIFQDFITC